MIEMILCRYCATVHPLSPLIHAYCWVVPANLQNGVWLDTRYAQLGSSRAIDIANSDGYTRGSLLIFRSPRRRFGIIVLLKNNVVSSFEN